MIENKLQYYQKTASYEKRNKAGEIPQGDDAAIVFVEEAHDIIVNGHSFGLSDGSVTAAKLADGAVTTDKIGHKSITADKIADNVAVGVPDKSITSSQLADEAVTTPKLADGAITSGKLADYAIKTDKLADKAVTEPKLDDDAVSTRTIIDKNVTTPKLADGAVTNEKISNNAVTASKIAENSINESKLAINAVTNEKIKEGAITESKIDASVFSKVQQMIDSTSGSGSVEVTAEAQAGPNINIPGTPSVTATADKNHLTFTFNNLKGDKGEPGDPGEDGQNGENGVSPNLTIGNVSTGAAGSNAQASITGTFPDLKLNLTIPQGQKGEDGSGGQSEPTRGVTTYNDGKEIVSIDAARYSLVIVNCTGNVTDLNFATVPPAGKDVTIIFKNEGGTSVSVKQKTNIMLPTHKDVSLEIALDGYVEVNAISDGTTLYIRHS